MIPEPRFQVDLAGAHSLAEGASDAREAFETVWERLAIGRDWRARRIVADERGGAFFVKGMRIPPVAGTQHWMRRFHIGWEFHNLVAFRDAGIALPTPLGWGCETRAGLPMRSFLVTRVIPACVDLEQILRDPDAHGLGDAQRRDVFRSAGREIRRMHDAGITHGDLSCRNVLVRLDGDAPRVVVIDVPRARRHARLPVRGRRTDLYRITKSALRWQARPEDVRALLEEIAGTEAAAILDSTRRIRAIRRRARRKIRREFWLATGR